MNDKLRTALIGAEAYIEEIRKALYGYMQESDTIEAIKKLRQERDTLKARLRESQLLNDKHTNTNIDLNLRIERLQSALEGLDNYDDHNRIEKYCVVCRNAVSLGHKPDCKLAAALQDTQPNTKLQESINLDSGIDTPKPYTNPEGQANE